ncbi:hypothetical protein FACS189434_08390 [Bacteroidia bacterium]|nr:hypothetical protein FACS189434_08390 [Bacteroidia bacterium]
METKVKTLIGTKTSRPAVLGLDFMYRDLKRRKPKLLRKKLESLYKTAKIEREYSDEELLVFNSRLNISKMLERDML